MKRSLSDVVPSEKGSKGPLNIHRLRIKNIEKSVRKMIPKYLHSKNSCQINQLILDLKCAISHLENILEDKRKCWKDQTASVES